MLQLAGCSCCKSSLAYPTVGPLFSFVYVYMLMLKTVAQATLHHIAELLLQESKITLTRKHKELVEHEHFFYVKKYQKLLFRVTYVAHESWKLAAATCTQQTWTILYLGSVTLHIIQIILIKLKKDSPAKLLTFHIPQQRIHPDILNET